MGLPTDALADGQRGRASSRRRPTGLGATIRRAPSHECLQKARSIPPLKTELGVTSPVSSGTSARLGRDNYSPAAGVAWDLVCRAREMTLGLQLRGLVELLACVAETQSTGANSHHGSLWHANFVALVDGTVAVVMDRARLQPQPMTYVAPEVRAAGTPDPLSDIFSIGAMLLEALAGVALSVEQLRSVRHIEVSDDRLWRHWAGDPLLYVAIRATDAIPSRRWASAREMVEAIEQCSHGRLSSRQELGELVRVRLSEQSSRATPIAGLKAELGTLSLPIVGTLPSPGVLCGIQHPAEQSIHIPVVSASPSLADGLVAPSQHLNGQALSEFEAFEDVDFRSFRFSAKREGLILGIALAIAVALSLLRII